jgi:hypothetical protein
MGSRIIVRLDKRKMGAQLHFPAALPPVPIGWEAGWATEPVLTRGTTSQGLQGIEPQTNPYPSHHIKCAVPALERKTAIYIYIYIYIYCYLCVVFSWRPRRSLRINVFGSCTDEKDSKHSSRIQKKSFATWFCSIWRWNSELSPESFKPCVPDVACYRDFSAPFAFLAIKGIG